MTEITDTTIDEANGVIFFDAACGPCSASATRLDRIVGKRGFVFRPLQDPSAPQLTHLSPEDLRREMTLWLPDGRVLVAGGGDPVAGAQPSVGDAGLDLRDDLQVGRSRHPPSRAH